VAGVSGAPSPQDRLRALGAAVTIGTDRTGGDQRSADALLTDAARFGTQARAGWRPSVHSGRLPDPPRDDRPSPPRSAMATLLRLLANPDPALIEEWAQLALSHGMRVDGADAPLLLDWWARQPRRSESVFAALGGRGEWLASLNPDWHKPVATTEIPADAGEAWQAGTSAERLAILTTVRRQDPARALALVESTWQSDGANDRQRFLEALVENRSMADEPFLEAALDDRSKLVRRQAAALLALIPGSRLRQRLSDEAKPMITIRTSRGILGRGRRQIVLVPPESFAATWARDGIDERPPEGVGPRAWWMRQILAGADLAVWTECTGMTPEAILESLKKDDYFGEALHALIAAVTSTGDPAWSTALVRSVRDQRPFNVAATAALLEALPDDQRESLSLETAAQEPLTMAERWTVLTSFDRAWSEAFSARAMQILSAHGRNEMTDVWSLSRAIEAASRRISPNALAAFEDAVARTLLDAAAGGAMKHVERVRLRAEMHKEFRT
jgi:hypothetical protein